MGFMFVLGPCWLCGKPFRQIRVRRDYQQAQAASNGTGA